MQMKDDKEEDDYRPYDSFFGNVPWSRIAEARRAAGFSARAQEKPAFDHVRAYREMQERRRGGRDEDGYGGGGGGGRTGVKRLLDDRMPIFQLSSNKRALGGESYSDYGFFSSSSSSSSPSSLSSGGTTAESTILAALKPKRRSSFLPQPDDADTKQSFSDLEKRMSDVKITVAEPWYGSASRRGFVIDIKAGQSSGGIQIPLLNSDQAASRASNGMATMDRHWSIMTPEERNVAQAIPYLGTPTGSIPSNPHLSRNIEDNVEPDAYINQPNEYNTAILFNEVMEADTWFLRRVCPLAPTDTLGPYIWKQIRFDPTSLQRLAPRTVPRVVVHSAETHKDILTYWGKSLKAEIGFWKTRDGQLIWSMGIRQIVVGTWTTLEHMAYNELFWGKRYADIIGDREGSQLTLQDYYNLLDTGITKFGRINGKKDGATHMVDDMLATFKQRGLSDSTGYQLILAPKVRNFISSRPEHREYLLTGKPRETYDDPQDLKIRGATWINEARLFPTGGKHPMLDVTQNKVCIGNFFVGVGAPESATDVKNGVDAYKSSDCTTDVHDSDTRSTAEVDLLYALKQTCIFRFKANGDPYPKAKENEVLGSKQREQVEQLRRCVFIQNYTTGSDDNGRDITDTKNVYGAKKDDEDVTDSATGIPSVWHYFCSPKSRTSSKQYDLILARHFAEKPTALDTLLNALGATKAKPTIQALINVVKKDTRSTTATATSVEESKGSGSGGGGGDVEKTEDKEGTGDNVHKATVDMLKKIEVVDGHFLQVCHDNNIPLFHSYIACRPEVVFNVGMNAMVVPGSSTMEVPVAKPESWVSIIAKLKTIELLWTLYASAILKEPRNVCHADTEFITKYIDGGGMKPYNMATRPAYMKNGRDKRRQDVFYSLLTGRDDPLEIVKRKHVDITGHYAARYCDDRTVFPFGHWSTAGAYADFWGHSNEQQTDETLNPDMRAYSGMNTVCWRTKHTIAGTKDSSGNHKRRQITGDGHLGNRVGRELDIAIATQQPWPEDLTQRVAVVMSAAS